MLYAPWDGDSQNAKPVIERVAQTLIDSDTYVSMQIYEIYEFFISSAPWQHLNTLKCF